MPKTTSEQIVSRRSILRAAAWAVPAVAVAVATPALAASDPVQPPLGDDVAPGQGGTPPRPAPPRPRVSPLKFSAHNSWAHGGESGVILAHTIMTVTGEGDPAYLPNGFTSLFYSVDVTNLEGQQVHYTEVAALIPESNYGASPTQKVRVTGLDKGRYTVTWQILSATDSNGHVLSPVSPENQFMSVVVDVNTW